MYSRVYVEITNICNMRCSFCHGHSRTPRQMTEEEFDRILDQLTGKTEYIYYHLMGEPLTHPLLPRFMERAAEKGFHSVLTTNGTLLKKRSEEILNAGIHKVSISLHSFEEGEDTSFIRYLTEVADFAETAVKAGVLISLRLWNKGCDGGRNDAIVAFLQQRFPEPWTENPRGFRIRERLYLEWGDRFVWPDKDAPVQGEKVYCYGMGDHFGILCDGTVVPCCLDSEGVINLGNVFCQDLESILHSDRATAIRKGFQCRVASEELCRRCAYARRFG